MPATANCVSTAWYWPRFPSGRPWGRILPTFVPSRTTSNGLARRLPRPMASNRPRSSGRSPVTPSTGATLPGSAASLSTTTQIRPCSAPTPMDSQIMSGPGPRVEKVGPVFIHEGTGRMRTPRRAKPCACKRISLMSIYLLQIKLPQYSPRRNNINTSTPSLDLFVVSRYGLRII